MNKKLLVVSALLMPAMALARYYYVYNGTQRDIHVTPTFGNKEKVKLQPAALSEKALIPEKTREALFLQIRFSKSRHTRDIDLVTATQRVAGDPVLEINPDPSSSHSFIVNALSKTQFDAQRAKKEGAKKEPERKIAAISPQVAQPHGAVKEIAQPIPQPAVKQVAQPVPPAGAPATPPAGNVARLRAQLKGVIKPSQGQQGTPGQ